MAFLRLRVHVHHHHHRIYPSVPRRPFPTIFFSSSPPPTFSPKLAPLSFPRPNLLKIANFETSILCNEDEQEEEEKEGDEFEDLARDGAVFRRTLRMVECSMFAAVTGLVYFLSNSLAIENYFGCFFSLPVVISSLRWGIAAGRKQLVATVMLLFVLSGPVKALNYLLTHGILGLTMGSLWRLGANWGQSILLCTLARSLGAVGYVLTSSFLIRENILALITVNIHASLTFIFSALGFNTIPSMNFIYALFGTLVLLNSAFFVFLLHILYSLLLARLGMKDSLKMPRWLEKAIQKQ